MAMSQGRLKNYRAPSRFLLPSIVIQRGRKDRPVQAHVPNSSGTIFETLLCKVLIYNKNFALVEKSTPVGTRDQGS
jgi:hypothetical protein